ncbi:twin-arginine translocation pathway signal [Burkholderia sp. Ax-1724]|nr:twin-arginine translocation pathway signal [Burkholderia sp. Ax-1724]
MKTPIWRNHDNPTGFPMKNRASPNRATPRGWTAVLAFAALAASIHCGAARAAASVIEGQDGWLFPGWESTDKVDRPQIEANVKLIREAKDALAAKHVELVVMVVPAKSVFYPQRLPADVRLSPQVQSRYGDLLGMFAAAGIVTFDDRPALQSVEHDRQSAFYRADYHWTAWAAEASADATAALIRGKFAVPATGGGSVLGDWTNERRYGDLATNFMSPEDRKRIGRDIYTVRKQPEAADGLLDSGPAQVEVIGNSFVQPYLGYPQKLSNALGVPVGLAWNPGNIGPWKTFLDTVANPSFAQHAPKVVVWQFNEDQLQTRLDAPDSWDPKSVMPAATWLAGVSAALGK